MSESSSRHERTRLLQPETHLGKTGGTDVYATETAIDEEAERSCPSTASSRTQTSNPGVAPWVVVLVLTIGVFIAQLDTSFVLATHSTIASEFDQLANSSWLVVSYSLAMCAVQPIYGKVSDIYGRKESLIVAYSFFALGCLICGISKSLFQVVLGRVVSGIGSAGASALVSLIILDLVPLRQVASLRSYVNIAATTGRSLGGPIGGFLSDTIGWRWSFLAQAPLIAISAFFVWILVPHKVHDEDDAKKDKFSRIDFTGAFLLAATITSFLLVVEIGGRKVAWTHPLILILLATSILSAVMFVITETRWAVEPIFPIHLLKQKDVICQYLVMALQIAAQLSMMFCVPLYFQITQNASATLAGAHLFPAVGGNAIGALLSGWIIKRNGRYKVLAATAPLIAATCYVLLILRWHGNTNFWESLYIIPGGFGTGMAEASTFIGLSASVTPEFQAIAIGGLFLASNIGTIIGLAGSSAIAESSLQRELTKGLAGYPNKEKIIERAISDISYVLNLKGKLKDIISHAYILSLEYTHGTSNLFTPNNYLEWAY
ncbi:multidrug resistance protein [Venturia nashicola]|nr:multidrug resistance protein [Venturia nashicola]